MRRVRPRFTYGSPGDRRSHEEVVREARAHAAVLSRDAERLGNSNGHNRVLDPYRVDSSKLIREENQRLGWLAGLLGQEIGPMDSDKLARVSCAARYDLMLTPQERLFLLEVINYVHDKSNARLHCDEDLESVCSIAGRWLGFSDTDTRACVAVLIARGWLPAPEEPRVNLKPSERFKILDRDGFRCRYCGASGEDTQLHVDHVIPVSKGGTNDPDNLVASCEECNLGKAARLLRTPLTAIKGGK